MIIFYLPLNNIHEYPSSSVIDNDVRVSPIAIESRSIPLLPLLNMGHVMCNWKYLHDCREKYKYEDLLNYNHSLLFKLYWITSISSISKSSSISESTSAMIASWFSSTRSRMVFKAGHKLSSLSIFVLEGVQHLIPISVSLSASAMPLYSTPPLPKLCFWSNSVSFNVFFGKNDLSSRTSPVE